MAKGQNIERQNVEQLPASSPLLDGERESSSQETEERDWQVLLCISGSG